MRKSFPRFYVAQIVQTSRVAFRGQVEAGLILETTFLVDQGSLGAPSASTGLVTSTRLRTL